MHVEITSPTELEDWLRKKPHEWGEVIACRAAMRVLTFTIGSQSDFRSLDLERTAIGVSRLATLIIGTIRYDLAFDTVASAGKVLNDLFQDLPHVRRSEAALEAAIEAGNSLGGQTAAIVGAARSAQSAAIACGVAARGISGTKSAEQEGYWALWRTVTQDCHALSVGMEPRDLLSKPLWPQLPTWLSDDVSRALNWLKESGDGFMLWADWFVERSKGNEYAFARFDAAADREFFKRLTAQSSQWWERSPADINREIRDWVEELRSPPKPDTYFISYATENESFALEVAEVLDELGHTYVVQFRDFSQRNFVNAMNSGLATAERLIALYSKAYVRSDHCIAEWNHHYNLDPSSEERRIVPFLLEPTDLKPLMKQIVYRKLAGMSRDDRLVAIRDWIEWTPPEPTRERVSQVLTDTLSPQIVADERGGLDLAPNSTFDQPEFPADLARALRELRMILDLVREDAVNLSRMMQRSLSRYDEELTAHGADASWGGLDRLIAIVVDGMADMSSAEFSPGQKQALEQLVAAHNECMTSLKDADLRMRDLAAIPIGEVDGEAIDDLLGKLDAFHDAVQDLIPTSERFDQHVKNLAEDGKEFAFEADNPARVEQPHHARKRYLLSLGGFGLGTLSAVGSVASIGATAAGQRVMELGQRLVDAFFRIVGL